MPVKDYRTDLLVRLANPDYAALYLKTALNETLKDGDREAFVPALRNVVEASRLRKRTALMPLTSLCNRSWQREKTPPLKPS